MMNAALKGDQFMQNMPMNQMFQPRNLQQQIRTNTFGRVNSVVPQQQQQPAQTLLPPTTSLANPSQQIINQIEQIIKNQNKVQSETTTKTPSPVVQASAQSKDKNFNTQKKPQVTTPQGGAATIQKPQFANQQQTTQIVTTTPITVTQQQKQQTNVHQSHSTPVVSNIRAGQNLVSVKRQQDLETTTFAVQQHLDSFHESSDELKKQSQQIEQLLEQEKQKKLEELKKQEQVEQQQKQLAEQQKFEEQQRQQEQLNQQKQQEQPNQQNQALSSQNVKDASSSENESFLSYPHDYYKKYLDYEPCMSSPCPFGKKCVNKSDSRGYECVAPDQQAVAARQLSGSIRKLNNRYQSNELLLALRKRKKLEDSLF